MTISCKKLVVNKVVVKKKTYVLNMVWYLSGNDNYIYAGYIVCQ